MTIQALTAPEATPDATKPLRKNRDFTLLWSGQTVSQLGTSVSVLAFPLLVLSLNGSAVQAGALGTLQAVIRVAFQLPAGALADRWNRKRVMQVCDAGRAVLFAGLATAILLGRAPLAVIFAVAGAAAVLDVLFGAAETSIVSQLVPRSQLPEAFAKNEARAYGASLAGPPLGGFLYALGRSVPFLFDALSYLLSLLAVSFIRRPAHPTEEETGKTSLRHDMLEGLRHVVASPFLRAVILMAAPVNFALTGAQFSAVLILTDAGHSPRALGIAQGCIAVGGLLGALFAARVQRLLPFHRLLVVALAVLPALLTASTVLNGSLAMVAPLATGLFLAPAVNSILFGRIAATTPARLQGRVISVVALSATAAASLAPIVVGTVVEHNGGTAAMTTVLAAACLSLVAALLNRRTLRDNQDVR
ncbi:MFS transporter [Streptomyces sp. NBC_00250]|uniref:MFS transporter n=1 Tax=Streptomyces sp. NBC_00250 TaxID=2903641 RepID=UPI002E285782|nr:MFS transporter [Streptomyces sp. NBC_00250]